MNSAEHLLSVAEGLRAASARLSESGSETPRLDAEVLLRHVLGLDRTALFVRLREPLARADQAAFEELVDRRRAGVPVAYLTGEREFMGLPFAARPGVLVPRPETEGLVEWALGWLGERPGGGASGATGLRRGETILDVGTGSGSIALAVAAFLPTAWRGLIVAADVSDVALAVAADNRGRLGLDERVRLVRGDLAAWCGGPVDLLLANLPYLRPDQVASNPDLRAEPSLALLGGRDGLDLIKRLVADAPRVLAPGGAMGLEIDPSQAETVVRLVAAAFSKARLEVRPDLAGLPRHVLAEIGAG